MKKKFLTFAIGAIVASQMALAEDEPRREREANADREVRREDSRPGDRERDRAPDERRVRGDREGDRRPDQETPPGVRSRGEGDREGGVRPPSREGERDRPPFVRRGGEGDRPAQGRPPSPRETDGRERPQRVLPQQGREGRSPSPERLRQEQQRGDQMVGALREELRSSQQLNAELRNRMQLFEQRLKRLEAR
jgi:hypothetical protein